MQCLACDSECLQCVNPVDCTVCITGWPVIGGCTTIVGCLEIDPAKNCIQCNALEFFTLNATICSCSANYYYVSQLCTDVYGCTSATKVYNATNITNLTQCTGCNAALGLAITNNNCSCQNGFELSSGYCQCLNLLLVATNYCYVTCPLAFFPNTTLRQCLACNSECTQCVNATDCTVCITGWPVRGGCTTVIGCA